MNPTRAFAFWGLTCLVVGAAFFVNALWIYRARRRFLRSAVAAEGTVVDVQIQGLGRNAVSVPVLEFATGTGRMRAESVMGSGFQRFEIGQVLPVRYDPSDPRRVEVDTFAVLWGLALLRAGFGGLFAIMGLAGLLLSTPG